MALDKLVDSAQLDSDLTSVANAIRTKGGTSASLAFPSEFVSAIEAIETGGGGTTPEVPTGYTQLKYVESSGTQIINTGFAPTLETKLQVTGVRMPAQTGYNRIAGCNNPVVYIPMANGVYFTNFYCRFGNSSENTISNPLPAGGTSEPPTITVDKTQATFEADGATKTQTTGATGMGTVDPNTRIALFGSYNGSSVHQFTIARIFRAKIWDDGVLVRDFVPAMRNADEEIGLFDIVNVVFYTNAGTGVFIGGAY